MTAMDALLSYGLFFLGFAFGGTAMAWFWTHRCAAIVDQTMESILKQNGMKRDGLKIVILGEDATPSGSSVAAPLPIGRW